MCASQQFLDNLTRMYKVQDEDLEYSDDVAMLSTSFVLNPEGLVTKVSISMTTQLGWITS